MLVFQAGANSIILTLNEAKTLESPEYILVLKEDQNKTQVACKLGTDLSDYPERFNKFTVTVNDDPEPLDAEVSLKDLTHHYWVYEMEDASEFDFDGIDDLDLNTLTGIVECGIAEYHKTETVRDHYANTTPSTESYGD